MSAMWSSARNRASRLMLRIFTVGFDVVRRGEGVAEAVEAELFRYDENLYTLQLH